MKNVRPAFELYEGNKENLPPGYQQIKSQIIFDIKLGENFIKKAQLIGGEHMTKAPNSITFLFVVSRDLVRIALNIASLNELYILACNINNAYPTTLCRENIWTFSVTEFGEEEGPLMLVNMKLYGIKSSGAAL